MSPLAHRRKLQRLGTPIPPYLEAQAAAQARNETRRRRVQQAKARKVSRIASSDILAANLSIAIEAQLAESDCTAHLKGILSRIMTKGLRDWMNRAGRGF